MAHPDLFRTTLYTYLLIFGSLENSIGIRCSPTFNFLSQNFKLRQERTPGNGGILVHEIIRYAKGNTKDIQWSSHMDTSYVVTTIGPSKFYPWVDFVNL